MAYSDLDYEQDYGGIGNTQYMADAIDYAKGKYNQFENARDNFIRGQQDATYGYLAQNLPEFGNTFTNEQYRQMDNQAANMAGNYMGRIVPFRQVASRAELASELEKILYDKTLNNRTRPIAYKWLVKDNANLLNGKEEIQDILNSYPTTFTSTGSMPIGPYPDERALYDYYNKSMQRVRNRLGAADASSPISFAEKEPSAIPNELYEMFKNAKINPYIKDNLR